MTVAVFEVHASRVPADLADWFDSRPDDVNTPPVPSHHDCDGVHEIVVGILERVDAHANVSARLARRVVAGAAT